MASAGEAQRRCYVYLDGKVIGYVADGREFANEIRKQRRNGAISGEVNVAYIKGTNEIHVNADRGRARRPYIIVENGQSKLTDEMLKKLE